MRTMYRKNIAIALVASVIAFLGTYLALSFAGLDHRPIPYSGSIEAAQLSLDDAVSRNDFSKALMDLAALEDSGVRRSIALRAGRLLAGRDPKRALSVASNLPYDLQGPFKRALYAEWANLEPAEFLRVADQSLSTEMLDGLQVLIPTDAARVFEIAARSTDVVAKTIQKEAMLALVETDISSAMNYLNHFSPRDSDLFPAVISRFANLDPSSAIKWFEAILEPSISEMRALAIGVAAVDMERGLEIVDKYALEMDSNFACDLARSFTRDPSSASSSADRLVADTSSKSERLLEMTLAAWAIHDPDGTIKWISRNGHILDLKILRSVLSKIAAEHPVKALELVNKLPSNARAAWIGDVAEQYSERDPLGALDWLETQEWQNGHEPTYLHLIRQLAESQPEVAARRLTTIPLPLMNSAAQEVAIGWAKRDAAAAASWLSRLEVVAPQIKTRILERIISTWITEDARAASNWVIAELPRGTMRDDALLHITARSNETSIDPRVVSMEIDSESKRRYANRAAVDVLLRQNKTSDARAILKHLEDDPELGPWATDVLRRISQ